MPPTQDPEVLRLCVKLAEEALLAGDDPFGSVLVDDASGRILAQDRNRTVTGPKGDMKPDSTYHPEIELARWAQRNLEPEERSRSTVYTSGEHCAMCAAAHAYCGLGRIVFISSTEQYESWKREFGVRPSEPRKVGPLRIRDVAPATPVEGPVTGYDEEVKSLHRRKLVGSL